MGASEWSYYVPFQPDLNEALKAVQHRVFTEGEYWWAHGEFGVPASAYDDRPTTLSELFDDDLVRQSGTHSILDMKRVLREGEPPDYGTIQPVSKDEAIEHVGTDILIRQHVDSLLDLATRRWFGRCAILHDDRRQPDEIFFWGFSGD